MPATQPPPNKPRTAKQREASRRNGRLSKGPLTAAGKAAASLNSLQHGLCACKNITLANEDPARLAALRDSYLFRFQPADPVEIDLVEQAVAAQWRLRRYAAVETALLDDEMKMQFRAGDQPSYQAERLARAFKSLADESSSLALVGRYQVRIARDYHRALSALANLRRDFPAPPGSSPDSFPTPPPIPGVHYPVPNEPGNNPSPAESEDSSPAPSTQPAPAPASSVPATPRNAPCPCRSGLKFKRCCGKSAPPRLFQGARAA